MKFNYFSLALCILSLFVACTQTDSKPKAIPKPLTFKDVFLGNWMLTPAKGEAEIIVIDSIGKIYGNINYTKLTIPTPEIAHGEVLVFDKTKKEPLSLHFKIKGTEIDFLEIKDGKETVVFNLSRFMK